MAGPGRFDPRGYLKFDLSKGTIRTDRPAGQAFIVPSDAVATLIEKGGDSTVLPALGRALGESLASRLRSALAGSSSDPLGVSPEAFLSDLNVLLAVHGLGRFSFEMIGSVLVVHVEGIPVGLPGGGAFLESLMAGLLSQFMGEDVRALALPDPSGAAVLVGSAAAIGKASIWAKDGSGAEAVALRLHREFHGAREGAR